MAYKQKAIFIDGTKAVDAWNFDSDVGWNNISGGQKNNTSATYFQQVPWLHRAVKDRSNNVGRMPFVITRPKGSETEEYETSTDYKNLLEFLPNPSTLFKKLEMSLALTNRAYMKMEVNNSGYIKKLRYIVPTSIEEKYNDSGELSHYERTATINGKTKKIDWQPEEVIAIYDPDYMVENGPGDSSDVKAALLSAGVLFNADEFVARFFERGAIKATILTTEGFNQDEAERTQRWWDDVVAGVKNAWSALVVKGKSINPVVIGEGLESLQNESLTKERRQDIATAIGVPESRMWSAAANYATRIQDDKAYYEGTIIPDNELIAEAFNEYVFTKEHNMDGYKLRFQHETLDIFQADAADQANALNSFVSAGIPLDIASDKVGLDLNKEEAERIKAIAEKKESTPEPSPNPIPPQLQNNNDMQDEQIDEQDQVAEDMKKWERKAIKALGRGKSSAVSFESDNIDQSLSAQITEQLATCQTSEDIKAVFANIKQPEMYDLITVMRDLVAVARG